MSLFNQLGIVPVPMPARAAVRTKSKAAHVEQPRLSIDWVNQVRRRQLGPDGNRANEAELHG